MADYTHIDMMAQLSCNLPALDVTERPRYPIQVRLIRFPERLLTRACSLIADGRPASTPCCRSRGRQVWLQCRDCGRSDRPAGWQWSAISGRSVSPWNLPVSGHKRGDRRLAILKMALVRSRR